MKISKCLCFLHLQQLDRDHFRCTCCGKDLYKIKRINVK